MIGTGDAANDSHGETFTGQVDPARAHQELLRGLDGKQACPFCGSVNEKSASPCARCGMENTPEARKATKARIGPWYVLQARNPAAPGMRFETLLSFVRKGRVRARSIVRGPTTHQLWRFAAHVKGLSREFGLCFSCGSAMEATANICPQCNRLQEPPLNPDALLDDGSEEAKRTVFRELPNPTAIVVTEPAPPPAPPPEVDIVIPALGGFEFDDVESTFREGPPVTAPAKRPGPVAQPASEPFSLSAANAAPPGPSASPTPAFQAPAPQSVTPQPFAVQSPASHSLASAPHPAASENPFAIPPPRKKAGGPEAGTFLSAKELAAAFKLSFDPSADMDTVDVPDQMPASAMPEGLRPTGMMTRHPMASPGAAPAKRSGVLFRFILFVLILIVTGFAVLMWVDPGFRKKTVEWSKAKYAQLHGFATGVDTKPAPDPAVDLEIPMAPPPKSTASPDDADSDEIIPASPAPDDPPAARVEALVKPAPAVKAPPAVAGGEAEVEAPVKAAPAVKTEPARRPSPAKAEASAPEKSAPPAADPVNAVDPTVTTAQVKALYNAGIVAQGRDEFAKAIESYEGIKKHPEKFWPRDLETRLANVRRRMSK